MSDLLNVLHDEVDDREEIDAMARDIVARAKASMGEAADLARDPEGMLRLVVALVEDDLAGLTTRAFQTGVKFVRKREAVSG